MINGDLLTNGLRRLRSDMPIIWWGLVPIEKNFQGKISYCSRSEKRQECDTSTDLTSILGSYYSLSNPQVWLICMGNLWSYLLYGIQMYNIVFMRLNHTGLVTQFVVNRFKADFRLISGFWNVIYPKALNKPVILFEWHTTPINSVHLKWNICLKVVKIE